ncbi:hypothetical protein D3C86_2230920 [compost metagenome]|jgi:hypothetical protein
MLLMKEDAAAIGVMYAVSVGELSGYAGYQQYLPNVGVIIRLYDAEGLPRDATASWLLTTAELQDV